jgi:hypothetical protein
MEHDDGMYRLCRTTNKSKLPCSLCSAMMGLMMGTVICCVLRCVGTWAKTQIAMTNGSEINSIQ